MDEFRPIELMPWHGTKRTNDIIRNLKKLALGKAKVDIGDKTYEKIRELFLECEEEELRWWSTVVMIRPPDAFAGATGAGAWMAVASRHANEIASTFLKIRGMDESHNAVINAANKILSGRLYNE